MADKRICTSVYTCLWVCLCVCEWVRVGLWTHVFFLARWHSCDTMVVSSVQMASQQSTMLSWHLRDKAPSCKKSDETGRWCHPVRSEKERERLTRSKKKEKIPTTSSAAERSTPALEVTDQKRHPAVLQRRGSDVTLLAATPLLPNTTLIQMKQKAQWKISQLWSFGVVTETTLFN